jgi:5-formyltetrahydrofolate cyclo-ligase
LKKSLRDILLKKRDHIKPELKKAKEAAIKKRLFALFDFKRAKSILFYASFRSEVDTITCLQDALKLRKRISLPVVDTKNKKLKLFEIRDISELAPGYMGIPEPTVKKGREILLKDVDIAIIPGIGFDITGSRLGYGAGYYDRLLGHESQKEDLITVALAFEEQIVPKVPNEGHDVKVDKIITEKRIINCKTEGSRI